METLQKQGIELGPNQNIIKDPNVGLATTAQHAYHPLHTNSVGSPADVLYFTTDHSTPDGGAATSGGPSLMIEKPEMGTAGGASSVGVRKTSSMSGVSSVGVGSQASSVATGGSLKKDSFAANLHLMSATNETKQSVVGLEKQEIQQKIPEKLVSKLSVSTRGSISTSRLSSVSGSERMSKKNLAGLASSSSGISPSGDRGSGTTDRASGSAVVGNLVKPETVSQLLPFKLSEASRDSSQQQLYAGQGASLQALTVQQGSPGRQKLSSSSFGDSSSTSKLSSLAHHQSQYNAVNQQPQLQHSACYQYAQHPHNVGQPDPMNTSMSHRTGSYPHLPQGPLVVPTTNASYGAGYGAYNYKQPRQPPSQIQHQQRNNSNTLPKKEGKQKDIQKVNYNNSPPEGGNRGRGANHAHGSGEDKVIFF